MDKATTFYAELRAPGVVWTPRSVVRPSSPGYAVLAIAATLNKSRDIFTSVPVDGHSFQWHRRGAEVFGSRSACVAYMISQGWPL